MDRRLLWSKSNNILHQNSGRNNVIAIACGQFSPFLSVSSPAVLDMTRVSEYRAGANSHRLAKPVQSFLAQHGLGFGVGLLVIVSACAWLIGRQAARSVTRFRHEHHERFTPKRG
jgi:hypothetical protein